MKTQHTLSQKPIRLQCRLQGSSLAQRAATLGLALTLLSGGLLTAHAQSLPGNIDLYAKADLFLTRRKVAASGWTAVIARCQNALTPQQERQLKEVGADVYRHLAVIHSVALRVPSRNLDQLARLSFVQHLSSDMPVRKCDEFTVESSGAGVAFQQYGVTGQGVTVAVVDSGLRNNSDFGNQALSGLPKPTGSGTRLVAQVNFVPDSKGKVNSGDGDDKCGHGTHVAGIVGGNAVQSSSANCYRSFWGIAPQANLVNVRVLDQNGQSTVSTVLNGLNWIYQYNQTATRANKIRVVNLSLGHPVGESYTTDPLCQMAEKLWKAGIVVVCAAGNDGRQQDTLNPALNNEGYGAAYGSIQSPGNDPWVITVGAMKATDMVFRPGGTHTHTRANDRIATYSSRGPSRLDYVCKPDLVAPGNRIISTVADGSTLDMVAGQTNNICKSQYIQGQGAGVSGDYFLLSGTSMAAPVVAGAAAMLLQKDMTLTPDTIKARLMLSADKWTAPDGSADPCTYGAGYLNIPAALQSTALPNQAALSPSLSQDNSGNVYINMDRAIWGTDINGNRALWGVSSVTDTRALWGTRAIWGTSTNVLNASRALWGTSVWGDRAIWGTSSSAVDLTNTAISGE